MAKLLIKLTLQNMYEIDDELRISFKFELVPHLYRCPDGYHFDSSIRICRKKEIANCKIHQPSTTPTPRVEELGLLELLFSSLV